MTKPDKIEQLVAHANDCVSRYDLEAALKFYEKACLGWQPNSCDKFVGGIALIRTHHPPLSPLAWELHHHRPYQKLVKTS